MTLLTVLRRFGGLTGVTLALGIAALLPACGGGTSQVEPFKPGRVIVLGDETSVIVNDGLNNGRKYTVNGLDSNGVRDCTLQPNWVQVVAAQYGFVFAECNKDAATPKALMRAKVGAKVDDPTIGMASQIAEQQASGEGFKSNDLVTILIGQNDLIELSERVIAGTLSEADAVGEARRRGAVLAERVNTILATGAKGLVSTVPNVGLSPYATKLNTTSAGASARLSNLVYEFNAALRTTIDQTRFDGRNYGLVLTDDTVQALARFPTSYGFSNVIDAVCVAALPNCTTAAADLVSGASVDGYAWASDRLLSPRVHSTIGSQAVSRAINNPF
ncbi:MAG: esterase [Burkholderiales bacterium]|nr:esterase [Burkholderiales bacterium]